MPGRTVENQGDAQKKGPRKLVLCFDGTGNTFTGSNSDTNVVKLLHMLDRNAPDQYHYYQTGIGTYDVHDESVNKSFVGQIKSSISQTVDQGIGTTFDSHVMSGYRFLMRYYESGDKIYMFGFSRGAFTAKFLARMINTVGLLCKGNEEMVPFAYRLYQRYLAGKVEEFKQAHNEKPKKKNKQPVNHDTPPQTPPPSHDDTQRLHQPPRDEEHHGPGTHQDHKFELARDELAAFSQTFCRKEEASHCETKEESNIKVYFLGLWDCVNSVAVLERKAPVPLPVYGTADHVRHAVAVDERRVKFKATLFAQDVRRSTGHNHEDILEVWFPGSHGDIGGGWPASDKSAFDKGENMTTWERIKNFWRTRTNKKPSKALGYGRLQLSDIPLAWMIHEIDIVDQADGKPDAGIQWRETKCTFEERFRTARGKKQAMEGVIHDSLTFSRGTAFFKVLLWKLMEWLPFITRWQLVNGGWQNVRFPLNKGSPRNVPRDAKLHESLLWRLQKDDTYCPQNNHGDNFLPCLKHGKNIAHCSEIEPHTHDKKCEHAIFQIERAASEARKQDLLGNIIRRLT